MTEKELKAAIRDRGLSEFEAEIVRAARPCRIISTRVAKSPLPPDRSKIGGHPDLPIGTAWPRTTTGEPMLYLAQMAGADFKDLAPQLAESKLLFFGAWDSSCEGKILCLPAKTPVQKVISPERSAKVLPVLKECSLKMVDGIALPNCDADVESWHYSERLRSFGATADPLWGDECPETLLRDLYVNHFAEPSASLGGPHRAFGYPIYLQQHPAEVAEYLLTPKLAVTEADKAEFNARVSRWIGLLSLETDDIAGLSFGETGNCGFLIAKEDLANLRFDRVHFYQDTY